MMMFTGVIFCCICVLNVVTLDTDVVVLRAVRGRDARLPCGQGKVFLDGPDSYILWLKNDRDFLYRFPNENAEERYDVDEMSVTRDGVFGTSCDAGSCHDDTSLLLKRVSDDDAGIYRCRVHYQASPSLDYVIDVRLVETPGTPRIYNEAGEMIKQGHVGPLSLGSDLSLICEVDDEQPDTLVYWRRNGAVIERAHSARPGVLRAEVHVHNATRDELEVHYECLAQNADVTEPLSASVVVRMYLPPISVEIRLNHNFDFEAGQPRVVDCVVVGCVPPPSITWHLGENLLRSSVHKELHDGNYTVSSLTLAPSLRDNKHDLVCRAHNSHLPNDVFEHKVTLNVGFEYYNDTGLKAVISHYTSSLITKLDRPVCLASREEIVGAVIREAETVTCVVEASPEPLQFTWIFADSRSLYTSVKKVPGQHSRYSSTLTWLPRDGDFGLLFCRATNSFGEQKRPCAYSITNGGPPHPPDCGMLRSYPHTVRVECQKGWDGGRPQLIHLELYSGDGNLLHNVSNAAGQFKLSDMEEDDNLTAILYASNIRGRSISKTMYLQTLSTLSASAITEMSTTFTLERWLEATAGLVAMCVAVVATAICMRIVKLRSESMENPDLVPRTDGVFHREPDFAREERLLGTTNITVNQLASCQNQYSSSPVPGCRVLVGCGNLTPPQDNCPTGQHSYFV